MQRNKYISRDACHVMVWHGRACRSGCLLACVCLGVGSHYRWMTKPDEPEPVLFYLSIRYGNADQREVIASVNQTWFIIFAVTLLFAITNWLELLKK